MGEQPATDPSQKEATPLRRVSPKSLLRSVQVDPASNSPEARANRARAAEEIAAIFELNDNQHFRWFCREFIDKPYEEAFRKLRMPNARAEGETLESVQQTYAALREVKAGMLEREIAHRELIQADDEEIPRLRDRLAGL